MWYKRRTLVKSIMVLGAAALPSLNGLLFRSTTKPVVKMRLVTTFPHAISADEWDSMEKSLVSPEFFDLIQDMLAKGEILREKMHLFSDHSVWEVDFKDIAASERWIQTINEGGLVDNERCRQLGYRVESYLV